MSNTTLEQIEADIQRLPLSDQVRLMERIAQHIRTDFPPIPQEREKQLAAMAADPDIQRELRDIEAEFIGTEADGLSRLPT